MSYMNNNTEGSTDEGDVNIEMCVCVCVCVCVYVCVCMSVKVRASSVNECDIVVVARDPSATNPPAS